MNWILAGASIVLVAIEAVFFGLGWALVLAIPSFILVVVIIAKLAKAVGYQAPSIIAAAEKRRLEAEAVEQARAELELKKTSVLAQFAGWSSITPGRILNLSHLPYCMMMIGAAGNLIRLVEFSSQDRIDIIADHTFNVRTIISMNIASPVIKKQTFTNQAVPIVSQEDRSPVGRGLVGAALLGPTGLVLGAASGLNGKISTTIEERKVAQMVDGMGEPQLILGLKDLERPILKIQFEPSSMADEWMFRIRAAQSGAT